MKKLGLFLFALITCLSLILSPARAQQKEDVIYLADGQQKKGKIYSITDDLVKFSYSGEEVFYELKKDKIAKIVFANGREEVFSSNSALAKPAAENTAARSAGNLLAVLPFEIVSNDQSLLNDGMRKKVQESCVEALRAQGLMIQFQDSRTTNALLTKAGINYTQIEEHTPEELAQLLGVDYIVLGVYDIDNKGASTYGSGSSTYENKEKKEKGKDKEEGRSYSSNNSYTTTMYKTKTHLAVYDASGRQLFSDSKSPLFNGLDSYNGSLKSLAKKVPLKK